MDPATTADVTLATMILVAGVAPPRLRIRPDRLMAGLSEDERRRAPLALARLFLRLSAEVGGGFDQDPGTVFAVAELASARRAGLLARYTTNPRLHALLSGADPDTVVATVSSLVRALSVLVVVAARTTNADEARRWLSAWALSLRAAHESTHARRPSRPSPLDWVDPEEDGEP